MSEKIECIARALCAARGLNPDSDWRATEYPGGAVLMLDIIDDYPELWRQFVKEARAAIEAMREPNEAMAKAGGFEVFGD